MRLSRARSLSVVTVLGAVAAVAVVYAYEERLSQDHYVAGLGRIEAYAIGAQPTTLTIYFTVGAGDVVDGATVREDTSTVTVTINTSVFVPRRGAFKNLAGYFKETSVTLSAPLGERVVIDAGTGRSVAPSPGQR
jgi:hypothetical protein